MSGSAIATTWHLVRDYSRTWRCHYPASGWHPEIDWCKAHLDIPKRLHKEVRYLDETIRVDGYHGTVLQAAVDGLGRERYTLFLSNNTQATARDVVLRYAHRNGIEDGLGISVNFFHLD